MSFLRKLFNRGEPEAPPANEGSELDAPCPHTTLVPRWDTNEDLGKDEKVARYVCDACGTEFSREEGDRVRAAEKKRLEEVIG